MDNSEEAAWVFDSLIGFLHGPIWNVPLQTFVEEKSLIFEPTDEGQINDRKEYIAIFKEYKNLVDMMLASYMEDIGITSDQFEAACEMSKHNVDGMPAHFHRRLFEQIWAANDYTVFIRMMTQRNVELQLQALELIEQRSGIVPSSYVPDDEQHNDGDITDEDIMEKVKRLSLEEVSDVQSLDETVLDDETKLGLREEKSHLKTALERFQSDMIAKEAQLRDSDAGVSYVKVKSGSETAKSKPQKEEILQRQMYLKQQRDKLLALKRQIREKQLMESATETLGGSEVRPKSTASTAKMMLAGQQPPGVSDDQADVSLQLRKALAKRLRSEVVDKS